MKINRTRYALLGLLRYREMSGYDLKKTIDGSIANFWSEDYGRIYPELIRMEKDGYVSRVPERKPGGPERKLYGITEKGERELERWLRLPCEKRKIRNELLLKIFFARADLIDDLILDIGREKRENLEALKRYEIVEKALVDRTDGTEDYDAALWGMTLSFGKRTALAVLEWCEESIGNLEILKKRRENGEAHS